MKYLLLIPLFFACRTNVKNETSTAYIPFHIAFIKDDLLEKELYKDVIVNWANDSSFISFDINGNTKAYYIDTAWMAEDSVMLFGCSDKAFYIYPNLQDSSLIDFIFYDDKDNESNFVLFEGCTKQK